MSLLRLIGFVPLLALSLLPARGDEKLPHLVRQGDCTQLIVEGKPFLLIAGELHNSSASTLEYVTPVLSRVRAMGLNTVLAPISWEQFEPREGEFDYTLIDGLIEGCQERDLKLVVLWFATWKNGQSTYAPMWLKRDTDRYRRVQKQNGERLETLSPFCEATRDADSRAFAALMRRIRQIDQRSTVIMVQPENEAGIFLEMDYGAASLAALDASVPERLMSHLVEHAGELDPRLAATWGDRGTPTKGSWREVFGDNPAAREYLTAWHTASFINHVAAAGRAEHPLPMFVNAWLVQKPSDLPGVYPNGGPVARVIDVYQAAAPELFTLAPDIYLPNFKEVCARYARTDNPLLIPESTVDAGRAFFAFAEHDAICYSPFGIEERADGDLAFQQAYRVLHELKDTVLAHQGRGSMRGFLREGDEMTHRIELGHYRVDVFYERTDAPSYGLIVQTAEDEFLVAGVNLRVEFQALDPSVVGYIGHVREVVRRDNEWSTLRVLNGDETFHHSSLRVFGRDDRTGYAAQVGLGPQPTAQDGDSIPRRGADNVATPGVYLVTTYLRSK